MRLIGSKPLTDAERQARHVAKIGAANAYAKKRKWERENPERARATKRKTMLKKYGLTPESYNEMWISQSRACAICKSPNPHTPQGWQVDHCHATGRVRGILCTHCNRMLAGAADNPEHLITGVEYLKRFSGDDKTIGGITMIRAG